MKNRIVFTVSLLAAVFGILACNTLALGSQTIFGTGSTVTQEREVGSISGVELAMPGTLHISMGDTPSLRIEAQDNLMEYIQTDTNGDTLVIHTSPKVNVQGTRPIQFYLTVEKLNSVLTSSDGDIEAGKLKSDSFSIRIHSSGGITIDDLDCSSLDVGISSSGNINLSKLVTEKVSVNITSSGNLKISDGQIQEQTVRISSSGEYRARDVLSTSADVTITSSGSATVQVSDRLSGRISSSGNIYYAGNPKVNVSTTSSGKVVQIGQ